MFTLEKKDNKKFSLVITAGDENGVGPEVILKALYSKEIPKEIKIIIVGSQTNFRKTHKLLTNLGVKNIINPNQLEIIDILSNKKYQKISDPYILSGDNSFYYLKHAIEIVKTNSNSALVTGPICKKSWALAGHYYSGQTELLAETCNTNNFGMLFTAKSPITGWRFNTLLATTHIPLKDVSRKLTPNLLNQKLDLLYNFCLKFNSDPSLIIAGLNPHAGEEGILGDEEKEWISKSLLDWKEKNPNVNITGPISPDSCWISSANAWHEKNTNNHHGILAMYHDQGLIPVKIIAQKFSVNTTIGLPFIRTSPDHGTGFDISSKGIADERSMIESIKTAYDLSINSRLFNPH